MSHYALSAGVPPTSLVHSVASLEPTTLQLDKVMVCAPRFWSQHGPSRAAGVEAMTPDMAQANEREGRVFGSGLVVLKISSLSEEALRFAEEDSGTLRHSKLYIAIDGKNALLMALKSSNSSESQSQQDSVPCLFCCPIGFASAQLTARDVTMLAIRVNAERRDVSASGCFELLNFAAHCTRQAMHSASGVSGRYRRAGADERRHVVMAGPKSLPPEAALMFTKMACTVGLANEKGAVPGGLDTFVYGCLDSGGPGGPALLPGWDKTSLTSAVCKVAFTSLHAICGRTLENKTHAEDLVIAASHLQTKPLCQRFVFVAQTLFPDMLCPRLLANRDFRDIAEDSVSLLVLAAWLCAAKAQCRKLSRLEGKDVLEGVMTRVSGIQLVVPELCALVDGNKNSQLPDMAVALGLRPKLAPSSAKKKPSRVVEIMQTAQNEHARTRGAPRRSAAKAPENHRPDKRRKTSRKVRPQRVTTGSAPGADGATEVAANVDAGEEVGGSDRGGGVGISRASAPRNDATVGGGDGEGSPAGVAAANSLFQLSLGGLPKPLEPPDRERVSVGGEDVRVAPTATGHQLMRIAPKVGGDLQPNAGSFVETVPDNAAVEASGWNRLHSEFPAGGEASVVCTGATGGFALAAASVPACTAAETTETNSVVNQPPAGVEAAAAVPPPTPAEKKNRADGRENAETGRGSVREPVRSAKSPLHDSECAALAEVPRLHGWSENLVPSVPHKPLTEDEICRRVVALATKCAGRGRSLTQLKTVRYTSFKAGAMDAFRYARAILQKSPFLSRTVESATDFATCGHALYKRGYASGNARLILRQASIPAWFCASVASLAMQGNGRDYLTDRLDTAVTTNAFVEEVGFTFDAHVAFEQPHHGVCGVGVYAVERDCRRGSYDDDQGGPPPRIGVYAKTRGKDLTERWVHMLEPILNATPALDALAGLVNVASKPDGRVSAETKLLFFRWRLQTTAAYEAFSDSITAALSHVAGYVSACAVLTLESAVMKEDLFTADLNPGPGGSEPDRGFLRNVKTPRLLLTMPACERQHLHTDVSGVAGCHSTADLDYLHPRADADAFFMWGVPSLECQCEGAKLKWPGTGPVPSLNDDGEAVYGHNSDVIDGEAAVSSDFRIHTTKTVGVGNRPRGGTRRRRRSSKFPIVSLCCGGTDIVVHRGDKPHAGDSGAGMNTWEEEWASPPSLKSSAACLESFLLLTLQPRFHTLFVRRRFPADKSLTAEEEANFNGQLLHFCI